MGESGGGGEGGGGNKGREAWAGLKVLEIPIPCFLWFLTEVSFISVCLFTGNGRWAGRVVVVVGRVGTEEGQLRHG